ncbi:MAG TPA: hypothetical protein VG518_04680, partial [Solirubrobacterales bacterium]|nr:hypothetical protein [Solirubrobacterales bacterium]
MASRELPSGSHSGSLITHWESARRAHLTAVAPRYLATAVLLIFFALGLKATFFPPKTGAPARVARASADAPSEDFALQFTRAYLTYDASHPGARVQALAPFVGEGLGGNAGFFAARGTQRVLWAQVASDQRALAGGRVITVAAGVSTQPLPVYLAVTVDHERGKGLMLMSYPSFVGAPVVEASASPPARTSVEDRAVDAVVKRVVTNYLAGSAPNLKADLTPDAVVSMPTVTLAVQRVDEIVWVGDAGSSAVLATVTGADERGTTYSLTYELGIAYRERPYVSFIEVIPTDT